MTDGSPLVGKKVHIQWNDLERHGYMTYTVLAISDGLMNLQPLKDTIVLKRDMAGWVPVSNIFHLIVETDDV